MNRALVVVLCLSACAAPPTAPRPAAPVIAAASPITIPKVPVRPAAPASPPDRCNARPLQYLVGRSRSEIPIPLYPGTRRVLCTTCPIDRAFDPVRQTIFYDARTDKVTSVVCG